MKGFTEQIQFWRLSARRDWKTAEYLFLGRRYDACLFFCHLSLEKLLKGLVLAQTKKEPAYTHNLLHLARQCDIDISSEQAKELQIITSFNISGRYDTEKREFYKKCTRRYAEENKNLVKTWYVWLKKNFPKT